MSDSPKYFIIEGLGSIDLHKGPILIKRTNLSGMNIYQDDTILSNNQYMDGTTYKQIKEFNAKCKRLEKKKRLNTQKSCKKEPEEELEDKELIVQREHKKRLLACLDEIIVFNNLSEKPQSEQAFVAHVHLNLAICNLKIAIMETIRDIYSIPITKVNISTLKRSMRKMREMYKKDRMNVFTASSKEHCICLVEKANVVINTHDTLTKLK